MPQQVKVSWSALSRWKKCNYKQKLVAEHKSTKAINGRNFFLGNLVDYTMRRWLEVGDFSLPLSHFLRESWIKSTGPSEKPIQWKGPTDQEDALAQAQDACKRLEFILKQHVIPYDYEPEFRFTSYVGVPAPNGEIVQVELFGAVDVAVRYPDGSLGIWDLKMSKDKGYIEHSLGQLTLYDLAIRNYLGVQPTKHGFFTPMLDRFTIEADIGADERKEVVSDIIGFCHDTWNNNWELTENENDCFGCQVRHACIRWVRPLSLSSKNANLERFGKRDT